MRIKLFITIVLLCLFNKLWSQEILIKGNIIEYQSLFPMEHTAIWFDKDNHCVADNNGDFEIRISDLTSNDTLKINFLSYYDLYITNIPNDKPIVDLGKIPMFVYFTGHSMATFNCRFWNIRCKIKEKKYWKKENERIENYYKEMDKIISYFTYIFRKQTYKIDNHVIDLSKPSDD